MSEVSVNAEQQLISADGVFSGSLHFTSGVARNSNYGIVAVVGCQSSGKSTLLNAAFGTNFPVLDAAVRGRRRTTLGVWCAVAEFSVPIVVLDVEGADSRERGDGARSFESRTALLALALSDVVVVNMWAHDIGRYHAANYELFETVFAHAAVLHKAESLQGRLRVLVAIRDYDGLAEVSQIRRVLMGDLMGIWDRLRIRHVRFDDLFDFQFFTLPHLKYAREEFGCAVDKLRELVVDLVRSASNESPMSRPPLVAFDAWSAAVWKDVADVTGGAGQDATFSLDLPRHTGLAAHYALGRIAVCVIQEKVTPPFDNLLEALEVDWRKPLEDFSTRINEISRTALAEFDTRARLVKETDGGAEAAEIRRREVGLTLLQNVSQVRERYLWVCRDSTVSAFEDELSELEPTSNGFLRQARRLANRYIKSYRELHDEAEYPHCLHLYLEERDIDAIQVDGYGSDPPSDETLALRNLNSGGTQEPLLISDPVSQNPRMAAINALNEDSDEEIVNEFAVDRFMRDVHQMVEEKRRMADVLGASIVERPTRPPWWKGLLMRGLMLLINYFQARQHYLAKLREQRKHEEDHPAVPTF